jgi:hypothetical protein
MRAKASAGGILLYALHTTRFPIDFFLGTFQTPINAAAFRCLIHASDQLKPFLS